MLKFATSATYWFLIVIWTYVLVFYWSRLKSSRKTNKLLYILFVVLTIDAFRTLFESMYFGLWYTSVSGFIPSYLGQILTRPEYVFVPKIVNVVAAVSVVFVLIRKWLPEELAEKERLKNDIMTLEERVLERTIELEAEVEIRKAAQHSEEEARGRIQAILDGANNVSLILVDMQDDEARVLEFSAGAENIFGYSRDEMINNSVATLHTSEDAALFSEAISKMRQGEIGFSGRTNLVRKGGDIFPALLTTFPIMNASGVVSANVGVSIDISDWVKTEQALKESEYKLRAIISNTPAIIYTKDREGKYLLANPQLATSVGLDVEQIEGVSVFDVFPKEIAEQHYQNDLQVFSDGQSRSLDESAPCGEELHDYLSVKFPIMDAAGNITAVGGISTDITERKKNEEELRRAKITAEVSTKSKSEFLANMSHEIRTPLAGLLGTLQLLESTKLDGEQQEMASMAIQSSKRLSGLLTDILDISRIEAGKLSLIKDEFNLKEKFEETVALFLPIVSQSDISLHVLIDPKAPKRVVGDSARLQQIITNVVGNSIKFTRSGRITVDVTLLSQKHFDQTRILFTILDTGIGISDEVLCKLFAPFSQASEGYSRNHQGAGLGLSICKKLIGLMGGSLSVVSELEKGTTVHFSLPFEVAK